MNIEEIIKNKQLLDQQLKFALSTMEKKETIFEIKQDIAKNQALCPHFSYDYNYKPINGKCPFCGKAMPKNKER